VNGDDVIAKVIGELPQLARLPRHEHEVPDVEVEADVLGSVVLQTRIVADVHYADA
jgi:hypothetical protein